MDGKANAAIVQWVGRVFGVRRPAVELLQGERGSEKILLIRGMEPESAAAVLNQLDPRGGGSPSRPSGE